MSICYLDKLKRLENIIRKLPKTDPTIIRKELNLFLKELLNLAPVEIKVPVNLFLIPITTFALSYVMHKLNPRESLGNRFAQNMEIIKIVIMQTPESMEEFIKYLSDIVEIYDLLRLTQIHDALEKFKQLKPLTALKIIKALRFPYSYYEYAMEILRQLLIQVLALEWIRFDRDPVFKYEDIQDRIIISNGGVYPITIFNVSYVLGEKSEKSWESRRILIRPGEEVSICGSTLKVYVEELQLPEIKVSLSINIRHLFDRTYDVRCNVILNPIIITSLSHESTYLIIKKSENFVIDFDVIIYSKSIAFLNQFSFSNKLDEDEYNKIIEYSKKIYSCVYDPKTGHSYGFEDVKDKVKILTNLLLPKKLIELFQKLEKTGFYGYINIVLPINDADLHIIPWEILTPTDSIPLALKYAISRQIMSNKFLEYKRYRIIEKDRPILLLGNLTGDLKAASEEINTLRDFLKNVNIPMYYLSYSPKITNINVSYVDQILQLLTLRPVVIHIASHLNVEKDKLVIPLPKSESLNIKMFLKSIEAPAFLYLNTCAPQSILTTLKLLQMIHEYSDKIIGMLLTSTQVMDKVAKSFAIHFYKCLLQGLPIGKALLITRKTLHQKSDNINWLSYIYFGNPLVKLWF